MTLGHEPACQGRIALRLGPDEEEGGFASMPAEQLEHTFRAFARPVVVREGDRRQVPAAARDYVLQAASVSVSPGSSCGVDSSRRDTTRETPSLPMLTP